MRAWCASGRAYGLRIRVCKGWFQAPGGLPSGALVMWAPWLRALGVGPFTGALGVGSFGAGFRFEGVGSKGDSWGGVGFLRGSLPRFGSSGAVDLGS